MPTGYTAKLCEGEQSFNEFVMQCSRAMGATIMMRDEPFDAEIPERFEPSDYHAKKVEEGRARIEQINSMSDEELKAEAEREEREQMQSLRQRIEKTGETVERLRAMVAKVDKWEPPTPDHMGLKTFMLEQLENTIDFDGDCKYYLDQLQSMKKLSGTKWKEKEIAKELKSIAYHEDQHEQELQRTEARNTWIKQLRDSLPTN